MTLELFSATLPRLGFFVEGTPQTAGSKRAFVNPRTGRAIITEDHKAGTAGRKRSWREDVRSAARDAIGADAAWPYDGPCVVALTFYRRRPKAHYGARGLKAHAPAWPTTRPDALKLARAVEDALSGIVWHDDSMIVSELLVKAFGQREGVAVVVGQLAPTAIPAV